MNKDSPPSSAEQAEREICDKVDYTFSLNTEEQIAAIIQQAIDRSVAETEEKYRKLAMKWRIESLAPGRPEVSVLSLSRCAYELESLIPKQEGEK